MPRRRKHPVLKWTSTSVALLALSVTVGSFWIGVDVSAPGWHISIAVGYLHVIEVGAYIQHWGLDVMRTFEWEIYVWEAAIWPSFYLDWLGVRFTVFFPLWPFVLLPALVAAWLWRRDPRRPGPGHCQRCGYDLRGNVSGRCPECGSEVRELARR